jgi:hypothetical protein
MRISRKFFLLLSIIVLLSVASADTPGVAQRVLSVAVDSDKIYAAVHNVFIESLLREYDRQTGETLQDLEMGEEMVPHILLYGDNLYTFSHDSNISVYSTKPELSVVKMVQTSDNFASITSSWVDEDYIYTYNTFEQAMVWNRADVSLVREFEEISGPRLFLFSDEDRFYGASSEGLFRIWDKSDWSIANSFQLNSTTDGNMTFLEALHLDDDFIYIVLNDGRWTDSSLIKVWNKTDLTLHSKFTVDKTVESLESDSENLYALVNQEGKVLIYDKPEFSLEDTIVYNPYEILSFLSIYDNTLFVSSLNGTIKMWSTSDFSLISSIGEALEMNLPLSYVEGIAMNPLPVLVIVVILLILNILLPEKFLKNLKGKLGGVSMKDIVQITILTGFILLAIAVIRPSMISSLYSNLTSIFDYFDVFVRKGVLGYYWFLLWPVVGYWLTRNKGRKISSVSSLIFSLIAYILFLLIP